jgi:hypothetical protein
MLVSLHAYSIVSDYLSSLTTHSRDLLDKPLDWDNDHERDMIFIADRMSDWEVKLSTHFKLSPRKISDIKEKEMDPKLQR